MANEIKAHADRLAGYVERARAFVPGLPAWDGTSGGASHLALLARSPGQLNETPVQSIFLNVAEVLEGGWPQMAMESIAAGLAQLKFLAGPTRTEERFRAEQAILGEDPGFPAPRLVAILPDHPSSAEEGDVKALLRGERWAIPEKRLAAVSSYESAMEADLRDYLDQPQAASGWPEPRMRTRLWAAWHAAKSAAVEAAIIRERAFWGGHPPHRPRNACFA